MTLTVTKIVGEGERLNRELEEAVADSMHQTADRLRGALLDYHENFGPCLLAVARAAVEWWRREERHVSPCACHHCELMAAIDRGGVA